MRILIVEDEFTSRRLLLNHLENWGDCDVASDGLEATKAVEEALKSGQPYTLICLDIMMPNMNGQDALRIIRDLELEYNFQPGEGANIMMTTGVEDSKSVISAFKAQCEAYLIKPVTRAQLEKQKSLLNDSLLKHQLLVSRTEENHMFKILVTEDDFIARRLLTHHLANWGDCDVAVDGAEAVQAVKMALVAKTPYELICLDIMMPNMSGQDALKAIRNMEQEFGIAEGDGARIIMTTAMSDSKNVMKAFSSQCEGYLVKPITREQLEKQLESIGMTK